MHFWFVCLFAGYSINSSSISFGLDYNNDTKRNNHEIMVMHKNTFLGLDVVVVVVK